MHPAYKKLKEALAEIIGDEMDASTYQVTLDNGIEVSFLRSDVLEMVKYQAERYTHADGGDEETEGDAFEELAKLGSK